MIKAARAIILSVWATTIISAVILGDSGVAMLGLFVLLLLVLAM